MKLLYTLIILFAFSFAEDEYPYFSDANKQLQFEEQKIICGFVESNFYSQINIETSSLIVTPGTLPSTVQSSTPMLYSGKKSEFEIKRNNKEISELEFLSILELNEKIDEIERVYKQKLNKYNREYAVVKNRNKEFETELSLTSAINEDFGTQVIIWNVAALFMGIVYSLVDIMEGDPISTVSRGLVLYPLGIVIIDISLGQFFKKEIPKKYPKYPELKPQLSQEQIFTLAESYNRNLYKQIQSQP